MVNGRRIVLCLLVLFSTVAHCPGSMILPKHSNSHRADYGAIICPPTDMEPGTTETTKTEFLDLKANPHGFERGMNTNISCPRQAAVGAPLELNDVPIEDVGGVEYRQFVLDTDSPDAKKTAACLESLKIYLACDANLKHAPCSNRVGKLAFDLRASDGPHPLILDDGSGTEACHRQFQIDIPQADFKCADASGRDCYVYLFSCLKTCDKTCHGHATWSVKHWCEPKPCLPTCVPEPGSLGVVCVALLALRRRHRR